MINQVKRTAISLCASLLILQLLYPIAPVIAHSKTENSTVEPQTDAVGPDVFDSLETLEEGIELSTTSSLEETVEIHENSEVTDDLPIDQFPDLNELNDGTVIEDEGQVIEAYNTGPNLFLNPGFNYNRITSGGTITNWELIGTSTSIGTLNRNVTFNGIATGSSTWISTSDSGFSVGSNSLELGTFNVGNTPNTARVAILSQTVSTVPGRTYQVSASNGRVGSVSGTFTMVAYNGNSVVSGSVGLLNSAAFSVTTNTLTTKSMQFIATGTQTTISFRQNLPSLTGGRGSFQHQMRRPNVAAVNRNLSLQASPVEGGSPSANTTSVTPGTSTTITANPNNGYRFVRWESVSGDGVITDPNSESTTFTMGNSDATVRAIYEQLPRTLTLEASPPEGGSPTSGVNILTQGQTTTLSANTNSGYQFGHWEIVSGAGAQIEDLTEPETAFTMGNEDTVVRAIYEANQSGEVHVHHVDLDGHELVDSEVLEGTLGTDYETFPQEIEHYQLVDDPDNANGVFTEDLIVVTYVYKATNVLPVDPLDPETEVDPENKPELPDNQGLLSIDFASQFQFGTQAISAKEKTYYAQPQRLLNEDGTVNEDEERPNYIQISDRRNENERNGWQLAVTQAEQFSSETGKLLNQASLQLMNQELVSAQNGEAPSLMMGNPLTLIPGNKRTLLRAEGTEGQGTWIYRFGDADSAGESVALNIPQGAAPDAETYTTRLLWELSIVPGNNID